MAAISIQEDGGGDYTTLASALADAGTGAGDVITITETWDAIDDDECTVADNNITIQATGSSKHPGHVNTGSATHHRLYNPNGADGQHCITVNNTGCIIDGLDICQDGTGSSDECIRMANDGGTLTVKNTIVWADANVNDQDGIYAGLVSCTVNCENVIAYGFGRAGFHPQYYSSSTSKTQTWNLNCCTAWNCGRYVDEVDGGGISVNRQDGDGDITYNINMFRCVFLENDTQKSDDYNEYQSNSTANWDIHNSIDSDNSIASMDGAAVGCLASRAAFDSDQGAGAYVLFEDITTADYDLRLKDLGNAKNNAQDMDATGTGAGLTAGNDIVGTSRPQNTNYDCGAFEIAAAGGAVKELLVGAGGMDGGSLGGGLNPMYG